MFLSSGTIFVQVGYWPIPIRTKVRGMLKTRMGESSIVHPNSNDTMKPSGVNENRNPTVGIDAMANTNKNAGAVK